MSRNQQRHTDQLGMLGQAASWRWLCLLSIFSVMLGGRETVLAAEPPTKADFVQVGGSEDEAAKVESFIADGVGTWNLPGKVTLEIVAVEHERFGKVYRAIFRWPENGAIPALRYEVDIASKNYTTHWAAAWRSDASVVWLVVEGHYQSGSSIRSICYDSPANIVVSTEFGDDHFDLRIPDVSAAQEASREAFSIAGHGPRIPDDLDGLLVKRFGKEQSLKNGITDLLPTGPYRAGGQHSDVADTEKVWKFTGVVGGKDGRPEQGVTVAAHSDLQPTVPLASTNSDKDGRFELNLRWDVLSLMQSRSIVIKTSAPARSLIDSDLKRFPFSVRRPAKREATFDLRLKPDEVVTAFCEQVKSSLQRAPHGRPRHFTKLDDIPAPKPTGEPIVSLGESISVSFALIPAENGDNK